MNRKCIIAMMVLIASLVVSCSTNKNTPLSRAGQSFKARYNTYFNGHQAYLEGEEAQRTGNKDNYSEIIPFYVTGNKGTMTMGKSNFDTAIEKCQKTIKQHSITKRPQWNSKKPKRPKDKIWLSQKEYNSFLYKAWFLMGEAQYRQGNYLDAASTFAYMQNQYFSKPDIVARARVLEAKCYSAMEWYYDSEDVISRAQRDSFPRNLEALKSGVIADRLLRQKQYKEAIPHVKKALPKAGSSLEKARLHFLLGQLYHKTGNDQDAYKSFKKVFKKNPPYELAFNTQIQITEVMSKRQSKAMIAKLKRMAKNEKNKDYLDQVYYAIGNIYMAQGDTTRAIWAYNDGVEKSTRNGLEKGVVMLRLGELLYEKEQFVKAQKAYAGVIGLIDKDREDYDAIDERSKILDELLPYATAVELQDSLQALARMDSVERMTVIKKMIEEAKKKEREEARNNAAGQNGANNANGSRTQGNSNAPGANRNRTGGGIWYFYNPTAVAAGKTEFQRKWGERALADDWRRNNKTVLDDFNESATDEPSDSVMGDSIAQQTPSGGKATKGGKSADDNADKKGDKEEDYANDPHRPEYYLKDIPFTDEQLEASNKALADGLYNAGVVIKDRISNLPLAEKMFNRLITTFPEYEHMDETYYNMFQLYSRMGNTEFAEAYRQKLMAEFPDNEHAKLVADPNFEFKGRYGKQVEDSLYQIAYDAYNRGEYRDVVERNEYAAREYPQGDNRARFMFITAMSQLELGERNQFMNSMKEIVEKYPKSTVSELAGLYVKGLKEGRLLSSGKMDNGSIWERRAGFDAESDSLAMDTVFTAEKNCNFTFVVAYERDSIDEKRLFFEVANYNFSNFAIRNFDLQTVKGDGIDMLQVSPFQNYQEAYIYLHRMTNNPELAAKFEGLHMFIISEENLKKLMKGRSFADYFEFYDKTFDRVGSLQIDENSLDEPTHIPTSEELEEMDKKEEEEDDENYIF